MRGCDQSLDTEGQCDTARMDRAEWDTETHKVTLFTETGAVYRKPYTCVPASIEEWIRHYSYTVDEISHDAFIDAGL